MNTKIDELRQRIADLQKQMDEAKTIEAWLKAYHEYLGAFLELYDLEEEDVG